MGTVPAGARHDLTPRYPTNSARGDLIAIPRGLAGYFAGIDTDLTTPVGVFNAHKAAGYPSCTPTAAALATLLGG